MIDDKKKESRDANRDPLTGAPGAHPVGVGVGAAGGAASGAAIGAIGGPVGAVAGAAVGGVVGGLAGKAVGEAIDPTVENGYWMETYSTRPYVERDSDYSTYQPAYQYGWVSYQKYAGRSFDEMEPVLARDWDKNRGSSKLTWENAKQATRDAWHRVERALPGDADHDGR